MTSEMQCWEYDVRKHSGSMSATAKLLVHIVAMLWQKPNNKICK